MDGQILHANRTIADLLLEENLISQPQYRQLKVESINREMGIDKLILERKLVSEEKYYEERAKLIGTPFISISTLPFSPEALNFIPKLIADRFTLIPFAHDKEKKTLSIAMADPLDMDAVNFLRQKTGLNMIIFQSVPSDIKVAIQNQYTFGLVGEVKEALKETEKIEGVKTFDKKTIA